MLYYIVAMHVARPALVSSKLTRELTLNSTAKRALIGQQPALLYYSYSGLDFLESGTFSGQRIPTKKTHLNGK